MANDQGLEIHLRRRVVEQATPQHTRRHFVERAAAQRPRLPGNLKQLGAVGPVTRPLAAHSRTAVVKVGITKGSTTGKHLSYLTHAKGPGTQDAALMGPGAADTPQFVQAAQQDRHQFRLVVSAPEYHLVDQTRCIQLFMTQVERDLGRPLVWTAAHHADTAHPHTHIVLRGQDRTGKDLYMERHYLTHGLRTRAAEVLTWLLGPVRQQQQFTQSDRLTYDGALRGLDDPDLRARVQQTPEVSRQADILAQARLRVEQSPSLTPSSFVERAQPDTTASLVSLAARLTALQQTLQAQQQAQTQQRGGWGYGG